MAGSRENLLAKEKLKQDETQVLDIDNDYIWELTRRQPLL